MTQELQKLIEMARNFDVSDDQRREQVRSWAIGQLLLANPTMIRAEAERLVAEAEEKLL